MNKYIRNPELVAAVLAVEKDQSLNLKVPAKLSKPHPMVVEMNLRECDPSRFKPNVGKIFNQGETFDFAVGKRSLQRAKLILDTFIKAVEKRGIEVINREGSTYLLISDEKLQIRLWEKSRFIENDENRHGYRDQELTGELFIQYIKFGRYAEKQWGDTAHTKLEDKLGRVIGSLEYLGRKEHEERIEREAYWEEQKRRDANIKEQNSRKETEFNNFMLLLDQSSRWEKAQSIRAFVSHVEANPDASIEGIENPQEWIQWAKGKADWYDPTVNSSDELLSPYGEFHQNLVEGKREIDWVNKGKL